MSDRRSAGERGKDAPEVHIGGQLPLDEVFIFHRSVVQRHRCLEKCILARAIIRSVKVAVVTVDIVVTSQQTARKCLHFEHFVRGFPDDEGPWV